MEKLWQLGAIELARGISKRDYTATQVMSEHLDRIAEVNPALNAIVVVMGESRSGRTSWPPGRSTDHNQREYRLCWNRDYSRRPGPRRSISRIEFTYR